MLYKSFVKIGKIFQELRKKTKWVVFLWNTVSILTNEGHVTWFQPAKFVHTFVVHHWSSPFAPMTISDGAWLLTSGADVICDAFPGAVDDDVSVGFGFTNVRLSFDRYTRTQLLLQ